MMQARSPLIKIESVSKIYEKSSGPIRALDDISLSIREGEFLAIMGPSGAGKSTLLYILGCLDHVSSGRYFFSDREVSRLADKDLSLLRATQIGFIFQTYNLLPSYDVFDNVKIPFLYGPAKRSDADRRAETAIKSVGLQRRMFHYPSELSGGEMQRAAIARALVLDPLLLLADEPTGNLDSRTGQEILGLIHELHHKGRTIVMVTHNAEIARGAQSCLHLIDGRIKGF